MAVIVITSLIYSTKKSVEQFWLPKNNFFFSDGDSLITITGLCYRTQDQLAHTTWNDQHFQIARVVQKTLTPVAAEWGITVDNNE